MNNSDKRKRHFLLPGGIGSIVHEGDLNAAIRHWKQNLKNSNIINELYDRKHFTKKSDLRRLTINHAKFIESKKSK
jgi:ribosomal protein S21